MTEHEFEASEPESFDPDDYVYAKGVVCEELVVIDECQFTPEAIAYFKSQAMSTRKEIPFLAQRIVAELDVPDPNKVHALAVAAMLVDFHKAIVEEIETPRAALRPDSNRPGPDS